MGESIEKDSISLVWNPPEDNGGSDITNYIVDKRNVNDTHWTTVNANCCRTKLKVTKLTTGEEFCFRVAAENKYGLGDFTASPYMTPRHFHRVPSPPGQPEIIAIT